MSPSTKQKLFSYWMMILQDWEPPGPFLGPIQACGGAVPLKLGYIGPITALRLTVADWSVKAKCMWCAVFLQFVSGTIIL